MTEPDTVTGHLTYLDVLDHLPITGGNMAITTYGTAGDPGYYTYTQPSDTWDTGTAFTPTPPVPNCTEAITILEEAEYELKELLKKNPTVKNIEIALRSTQAALRALLKVS